MPDLSLTDFVDIAARSGTPKATKIAEVKNRPQYHPACDFYKLLRHGITETHQQSRPKENLDALVSSLQDEKKLANYAQAISGYKKWWGKKKFSWFVPPKSDYQYNGFNVHINPELGLECNGQRYIIKLYLKQEPISKAKMDIVTELMGVTLASQCKPNETLALLDVRHSKLFTFSKHKPVTQAMIDAELAYISSIWSKL